MQKFTVHTGTATPLKRSNVDTDQIIPAVYLKRVTKTGFADGLFRAWREDPEFVLNNPAYEGASILVAGPEFGTGSSREHAVWALRDWGFEVVISPRFGDIFRGNALKEGLLPVELDLGTVEALWNLVEDNPKTPLTVDLERRQVRVENFPGAAGAGLRGGGWGGEATAGGESQWDFPMDDFSRWRLMEGLDDIGLTLRHEASITAHEQARKAFAPVVT